MVAVPAPDDATPRVQPEQRADAQSLQQLAADGLEVVRRLRRTHRGLLELLLVEDHPCEGAEIGGVGGGVRHPSKGRTPLGCALRRIAMEDPS